MYDKIDVEFLLSKWAFWKGLFIGAIGMLISLVALGLYFNY